MLHLIGFGLDAKDISLKGIEALKKCKKIYLETYTSYVNAPEIEKSLGVKIVPANRQFVEEATKMIDEAKKQNIALLVPGDPLAATTHIDLILRCSKQKVKYEIIHSVSIFNAIAETGLQLYKFGKTASIPKWAQSFKPESFYESINDNLKINAHTLLLIDIGLPVSEALGYIHQIAKKRNDLEMLKREFIVCSRTGTQKSRVYSGIMEKLMKQKIDVPACIIVPAELHFMEQEALRTFSKNF